MEGIFEVEEASGEEWDSLEGEVVGVYGRPGQNEGWFEGGGIMLVDFDVVEGTRSKGWVVVSEGRDAVWKGMVALNGKTDSWKITCREMMSRLDCGS